MIVCLIIAALFFVFSIFLFNGKGACLIAGFNTLSEQEKRRYNVKKMCRAMGILSMVCSAVLCLIAYLGNCVDLGLMEEKYILIFALIFVVVIITAIILVNRYIDKYAKK